MKVFVSFLLYFLIAMVASEPLIRNAVDLDTYVKEVQKENTEDEANFKEPADDKMIEFYHCKPIISELTYLLKADNFNTKELDHLFKIASEINPPEFS